MQIKELTYAALVRSIRTFCQAAAAYLSIFVPTVLSGEMLITEIDWARVIGIGLFAAIYSLLMSAKGLPEVNKLTNGEMTEAEALAEIMANPDIMGYEFEEIEDIPDEEAEEEDE